MIFKPFNLNNSWEMFYHFETKSHNWTLFLVIWMTSFQYQFPSAMLFQMLFTLYTYDYILLCTVKYVISSNKLSISTKYLGKLYVISIYEVFLKFLLLKMLTWAHDIIWRAHPYKCFLWLCVNSFASGMFS